MPVEFHTPVPAFRLGTLPSGDGFVYWVVRQTGDLGMLASIDSDREAVGLIRAIALAAGEQDDRLRAVDEASHALLASLDGLPHRERLDRLRAICDGCARETDAFRANQMPAAAEVMERSDTILRQGL